MLSSLILLSLASTSLALVSDSLDKRAIGGSCTTPDGAGTCQQTSDCTTQGFNLAGYCPGSSSIQCCVKKSCSTSSGAGICMNTGDSCSGSFVSGACPGDSGIKCCVSGGGSTPDPPTSSGSGGGIVDAAVKEKGLPYVWGGGGCNGPSKGGFDCSGLTQYSVCTALGKTIPRTADTQYRSSMGKHIPRAEAQKGDMLFWGEPNCNAGNVAHVGIFMRDGWMVNAAHTGTPVKEQAIWTSSGGENICPDAVRFW